jgi:phage terminase large subunit
MMDNAKLKLLAMAQLKLKKIQDDLQALYSQSNDKFIPLYTDQSRYIVMVGGGGSGKSIFAGRKLLHRMETERGHRFLICRKVARTLRESCFQQIRSQISEHYNYADYEINKTDMRITHKNGNEIIFSGLDDVEKLKSIYNVTSIWVEEASELDETDLNQLDIRLRGETKQYKQIILTFNPIDINHWLKTKFFDNKVPNAVTMHSTFKDNRFLDADAIRVLEQFKKTDPYYYQVYCLGEWGVTGKTIFNAQNINMRLSKLRQQKPLKKGFFVYEYKNGRIVDTSIKWIDAEDGYITIYEDTKPRYPYVIGGDTAGDGSDSFIGQVINNVTGAQVAVLRHQFDEDIYAKQMYCLGKYYNNALLGIETNFSTYPVQELQRLGYHNQFKREVEDTISNVMQERYGFKTTSLTRPIIIAELVEIARDHIDVFNDIPTLKRCLHLSVMKRASRVPKQERMTIVLWLWRSLITFGHSRA